MLTENSIICNPVRRRMYESSRLIRVSQLNLKDHVVRRIPRAGVLFYTFIDNEFLLCFGRDAQSGDLTDFGGGRRKHEDPIACAVREGNEESKFAFSKIRPEQVQGFLCLYNPYMLIIFIPVVSPDDVDIIKATETNFKTKQFLNKQQRNSRCFNEISEIVWLKEDQIDNLFSDEPKLRIFSKVRRFIYSCIEFSQSSKVMKNILHIATGRTYSSMAERFSPTIMRRFLHTS